MKTRSSSTERNLIEKRNLIKKRNPIKKRSPAMVVALSGLTATLYAYFWLYQTTDELNQRSDDHELNPLVDVLLAALTFGLYGLWAMHRNSKITHELLLEEGQEHKDQSTPILLFGLLSLVSAWAWLVSAALLQDDFNKLAELPEHASDQWEHRHVSTKRSRPEGWVSSPPEVAQVRVPEAVDEVDIWAGMPDGAVFHSSAPAPTSY